MSGDSSTEGILPFGRNQQIGELVDRIRREGIAGREWSIDAVCAEFADLLPELRSELEKLQVVLGGMARGESLTADPELQPGSQIRYFGDYEIIKEIARGGMGIVYKARQLSLNRTVALKVIRLDRAVGEDGKARAVERFQVEAKAAAQLHHPDIVMIFEVGDVGGRNYLSMEFVEGQNLAEMARQRPFTPMAAADMMQKVCRAVHYAHEQGILHRDLKPANVLIGADGRPRVADFGLAKLVNSSAAPLTREGAVMGTLSYMSPEQAAGLELGPTADVYSLGAMLYDLLVGRPPFRGATDLETLRQVQTQDPVPPRQLNPVVSRDLDTICLKCLEKRAADRYPAAQALADELGRFLAGEPIHARPLGPLVRAARWCRRKPLAAAVAGLALALFAALAVGMPLVTYAMLEANRQKGIALDREGQAKTAERAAKGEKSKAVRQSQIAEVRRLAAESRSARGDFPIRGTLLALEAVQRCPASENGPLAAAETELRESLGAIGGWPLGDGSGFVQFSPDGHWLATGSRNNTARLWDLTAGEPGASPSILLGHEHLVNSIAFSPDGHWLAMGSVGTVHLWDLNAGNPGASPRVLRGHESWVNSLTISPDGCWLAAGCDDKTVRLWDLTAGGSGASPRVLRGHEGPVKSLAFSPDAHWLATGSDDKTARLWDLTAGDPGASPHVLRGHEGPVKLLAISPDRHWLATGVGFTTESEHNSFRLWDLTASDPGANPRVFRGHEGPVESLAFSPEGHWLATGSWDATVRLWDLTAENPGASPRVFRGHESLVQSLAISPDGHWLATGSLDKTVRLWDLTAGDPGASPRVLRGHEGPVDSLAISPDAHWLATGSWDKTVRLWDLTAGDPGASPRVLRGHEGPVDSLAISPDAHWLATGSYDRTTRLWNLAASDSGASPRVLRAHDAPIYSLAISPDNHWLATGSEDNTARLWDLTASDPGASPCVLRGHEGMVDSLAISPDAHWLATGSWDHTARLWDLTASDPGATSRVLRGYVGYIRSLAISPDNHWLATGSEDNTARLWDLTAGEPGASPRVLRGHEDSIRSLAISPDGHWMATGSWDHTARLWDLTASDPGATSRVLRGHEGPVDSLAISPDAHWLATGSEDNTARLWDLTASDPGATSRVLRGHVGYIRSLAISPDGHWLATGSDDHTARLWDLTARDPGASPRVLRGHEGYIFSLAISPDGHWLATGSSDDTALLWDLRVDRLEALASAVCGRSLSETERQQYQLYPAPGHENSALPRTLPSIGIRDVLPGWPTDAQFHERMAAEACSAGHAFTAEFHEQRLIKMRHKQEPDRRTLPGNRRAR